MILTIESISGGDEGEREVVDILAIEGGESASGPDQRLASCGGVNQRRHWRMESD